MIPVKKIINKKENLLQRQDYIEFAAKELTNLRADEAEYIARHFHGNTLMKLPESEIRFFRWLQKEDPGVWEDLWEYDSDDLYLVSTDLLPQFTTEKNGFPICDLIGQENYWFCDRHIKPKGAEALSELLPNIDGNFKFEPDILFLYEMSMAPIDIWHFSYKYDLTVNSVKALIDELVYKDWIVHLSEREDLVKYIDV